MIETITDYLGNGMAYKPGGPSGQRNQSSFHTVPPCDRSSHTSTPDRLQGERHQSKPSSSLRHGGGDEAPVSVPPTDSAESACASQRIEDNLSDSGKCFAAALPPGPKATLPESDLFNPVPTCEGELYTYTDTMVLLGLSRGRISQLVASGHLRQYRLYVSSGRRMVRRFISEQSAAEVYASRALSEDKSRLVGLRLTTRQDQQLRKA